MVYILDTESVETSSRRHSFLRSNDEMQRNGMMDNGTGSSRFLQTKTMSSSSALLSDSELNIPNRILSRTTVKAFIDRETVPRIPEVNPYRILGVNRNASIAEMHNAYIRLALLNHPHRAKPQIVKMDHRDTKMKDDIIRWKFVVVSASYETLSNRDHRTNYNFANQDSIPKDWTSHQDGEGDAQVNFWDEIKKEVKRGLRISESNEETLDHDGVPCCNVQLDPRMKYNQEARDESEGSRSQTFDNVGLNLLRLRPSMVRGESEASDSGRRDNPRVETNKLFGGPLAALYKARSHEPFTDAFILFERESGSAIFRYDSEFKQCQPTDEDGQLDLISRNWLLAAPSTKSDMMPTSHSVNSSQENIIHHEPSFHKIREKCNDEQCYPSLPFLPAGVLKKLCREFSPIQDSSRGLQITKTRETVNGEIVQVIKKSRCEGNGFSIVRTERISTDFRTGKMRRCIQVDRQPNEECNEGVFTSCMPQSFSDFIASSLDTDNFASMGFGTKVKRDAAFPLKLFTTFDSSRD